ncbi:MAG: S1C family serine protease [Burkholderiaceae bacterium]
MDRAARSHMTALLTSVMAALLALTPVAPASAQNSRSQGANLPERTLAGDPTRFNRSIVRVDTRIPEDATSAGSLGPARFGTGIILDERTVLTIGYVTLEADAVMITTASGKRIPAAVAAYDHATGFGLVRAVLPLDGKPMALGDSDKVSERQRVLTLGQGEPEATEIAVLSRKPFAAGWEYLLERPIYTFPPVNNWSGAALINGEGALIAVGSLMVNDASAGQRGVPGNLWVPVNLLKPILADLLANGRRSSGANPWLGITTESMRGNLVVTRVAPNGPADAAGITPGDIVLGVGSEKVSEQADFYRKLWKSGPAGTVVSLRLLKGGDLKEVPVRSIDRADFLRKATGI